MNRLREKAFRLPLVLVLLNVFGPRKISSLVFFSMISFSMGSKVYRTWQKVLMAKSPRDTGSPSSAAMYVFNRWFYLIRWLQSSDEQTTSIVMTVTYGKRAHKILNNRHLWVNALIYWQGGADCHLLQNRHMIYEVLANFTKVGQPGNYLYAFLI